MTYADDITAPGGDYEFDTDDDLDLDDDEYGFGDEAGEGAVWEGDEERSS
ncbi:MAG: hypothetical protein ACLQFR_14365 [Streptosporangiaceae bacterium]